MKILYYNNINSSRLKKQYEKVIGFLENGDFHSAEVKKLTNTNFYRAKLDYENRLLFKFATYNKETYILLLELIVNHEYEKSRFLRGAKIDEKKLIPLKNEKEIAKEEIVDLNFINKKSNKFHMLNRLISFDDVQEKIFKVKPPVVIVGSAGSGKTVLTLEKIKSLKGKVLYITLSSFLVENSEKLYYSNYYINEKQEVDFLCFKEYLETIKIISGKELDYSSFNNWLSTRKQSFGIKDTHKLFEEFKGVITGLDITKRFLQRKDYLSLGIKQSIYLENEREKVYDVFEKYLDFLQANNFYDINMVSYQWLQYSRKQYDFIVIDEVQDFTNIQLYLILQSLHIPENFILCGDSNQIVHPNFFSWTNVKTMFYKHDISKSEIKVLNTNYRNSVDITTIANKLLLIKNARFGSIDKESTFLVKSLDENKGSVGLHQYSSKIRKQFNQKTARSTKFAVLVMTQEEKAEVRKVFKTPLLFSIHEAKGLEYDNIILVNFVSNNSKEFYEISQGIAKESLQDEQVAFSRGKDKADKSLDAYKFYINSLYVGITRAVKNLYILESSEKHEMMKLLDLVDTAKQIDIKEEVSSQEDWKEEARKLELQGKIEQAEEIKNTILDLHQPDWEPITSNNIDELKANALNPDSYNKKEKDLLFAYSLLYHDYSCLEKLAELKYKKAENPEYEQNSINRKFYKDYNNDNVKGVERQVKRYGIDYRDQFNLTPLLAAISVGSLKVLQFLIKQNANSDVTDNRGRTPFRIAINKSYLLKSEAHKLNEFFPSLLTDNVRIKVNDRLVKIPNRKMEYFLLNLLMTLQDFLIKNNRSVFEDRGINSLDIVNVVAKYPDSVLPDFRKKRTYISSILAKNEIDSNNPYNNGLFMRVERGIYVVNPKLEFWVEDKWKNIYDYTGLDAVKIITQDEKHYAITEDYEKYIEESYKLGEMNKDSYTELIKNHRERREMLAKRIAEQKQVEANYQRKLKQKETKESQDKTIEPMQELNIRSKDVILSKADRETAKPKDDGSEQLEISFDE